MNTLILLSFILVLFYLAVREPKVQPRNRKGRYMKIGSKDEPVFYGQMIKAVKSGKVTKFYGN